MIHKYTPKAKHGWRPCGENCAKKHAAPRGSVPRNALQTGARLAMLWYDKIVFGAL
jgi:hypothetical protein